METSDIMTYVRPICYSVLAIGLIALLIKRTQKKIVTYNEIVEWARTVCSSGDACIISILSTMPKEIRMEVRKRNGSATILNGYKESASIFVTITDELNNIKLTKFFMGNRLDKDLITILTIQPIHQINF